MNICTICGYTCSLWFLSALDLLYKQSVKFALTGHASIKHSGSAVLEIHFPIVLKAIWLVS